jgi:hypothetical protein
MERELFVLFLRVVDRAAGSRRRPRKCSFTDRDVLSVWVWAVLHDRPISWAVKRSNWPWHDRTRSIPSGATMSRRLRSASVQELYKRVMLALRIESRHEQMILILDAKPLPLSGHSEDPDVGFGRAASCFARGYKLHAIMDYQGNCHARLLKPMNASESTVACELLDQLRVPQGTLLLADGAYDSNELYDAAGRLGLVMVAGRRYVKAKNLGHQYQSPHRLLALQLQQDHPDLLLLRRRIETHFGTMGNILGGLSPLPNHVRRHTRVTRWIDGKLLIDALHRLKRHARKSA